MADMFDVRLQMIPSLLRSLRVASYILSFKDASELLMEATYISLHLPLSKVSTGIEKAFFHRTAFLYAILICFSHIFLQAGKALQQMQESGLMLWKRDFPCPQDPIILQMQVILIARNLLFRFVVYDIIFRTGML